MGKNLNVIEQTTKRIKDLESKGEIKFPKNYSPENALKSAYLILKRTIDRNKKPVLESCTKESIANSLLDMVVQGLNPAKKQCYFIPYGNKLELQRSYLGSIAVAKQIKGIKDIVAQCIYKGDIFKYEIKTGIIKVIKHEQEFSNIKNENIIGAYATIIYKDNREVTTLMTIDEIKQSWKQSKMNPLNENGEIKVTSTHGKFTQEMAKKTVLNRACKYVFSSSDDSNLMIETAIRNTENEFLNEDEIEEHEIQQEIEAEQATKTLEIEKDEKENENLFQQGKIEEVDQKPQAIEEVVAPF